MHIPKLSSKYMKKCIDYINNKIPDNEIPPYPPILYKTYRSTLKTELSHNIIIKKKIHNDLFKIFEINNIHHQKNVFDYEKILTMLIIYTSYGQSSNSLI